MSCELCGKPLRGRGRKVLIAGAVLTVCGECAKYGSPIMEKPKASRFTYKPTRVKSVKPRAVRRRLVEELEVVEDYAERIRAAREALGWTKEILAERVKEKVSVIRRIESGAMVPPIPLARKLESVLKVKLLVPALAPELHQPTLTSKKFELTLGDIAEIKFRRKR
ncbi:MAG: multiprotein bridging factor aMBF1 [archaeon GB-1867-005]|nr:multiprotein bridging factor aMBF1 [Candidatus Culexmicrobium cathedralense]